MAETAAWRRGRRWTTGLPPGRRTAPRRPWTPSPARPRSCAAEHNRGMRRAAGDHYMLWLGARYPGTYVERGSSGIRGSWLLPKNNSKTDAPRHPATLPSRYKRQPVSLIGCDVRTVGGWLARVLLAHHPEPAPAPAGARGIWRRRIGDQVVEAVDEGLPALVADVPVPAHDGRVLPPNVGAHVLVPDLVLTELGHARVLERVVGEVPQLQVDREAGPDLVRLIGAQPVATTWTFADPERRLVVAAADVQVLAHPLARP